MLKLSSRIFVTASLLAAIALPARAETVYLFAGDRVASPPRDASLFRFSYDGKTPATLTPAPSAGLGGALWGGGDSNYKGLDYGGVALGPDGYFYAVSSSTKKVYRLDGKTGAYKSVVLSGLTAPDGLTFGPDGNLYIADGQQIRRCTTAGAPRPGAEQIGNIFTRGGDINTASGLTFGPDGNLYVANQNWHRIERYDGRTGEYLGNFHYGKIHAPGAIAFGPDGNLYVACIGGVTFTPGTGSIARLDGKTGDFLGTFAPEAEGAMGLAFAPNGNLFVSSYWTGTISEFDGKTGKLLGVVAPGSGVGAYNALLFAVAADSAPGASLKPFILPSAKLAAN